VPPGTRTRRDLCKWDHDQRRAEASTSLVPHSWTILKDGFVAENLANCREARTQRSHTEVLKCKGQKGWPFKGQSCQLVTLCHPGLTYIFNLWHSGSLALSPERQSARMSEIKNVGWTWMALNTFINLSNHLMPLHFKGLKAWTLVIWRSWQMIGMSEWYRIALCGYPLHPFPTLTDN